MHPALTRTREQIDYLTSSEHLRLKQMLELHNKPKHTTA